MKLSHMLTTGLIGLASYTSAIYAQEQNSSADDFQVIITGSSHSQQPQILYFEEDIHAPDSLFLPQFSDSTHCQQRQIPDAIKSRYRFNNNTAIVFEDTTNNTLYLQFTKGKNAKGKREHRPIEELHLLRFNSSQGSYDTADIFLEERMKFENVLDSTYEEATLSQYKPLNDRNTATDISIYGSDSALDRQIQKRGFVPYRR